MTPSPITRRKVMMMIRIFTSQLSQDRSSKGRDIHSLLPVHTGRRAETLVTSKRRSSKRCSFVAQPGSTQLVLSRQLRDHREERHVQRDHDAADANAEEGDHDRLKKC